MLSPSEFQNITKKHQMGVMLPQKTFGDLLDSVAELDALVAHLQACLASALDVHKILLQEMAAGAGDEVTEAAAKMAAKFDMCIRLMAAGQFEAAQAVLEDKPVET